MDSLQKRLAKKYDGKKLSEIENDILSLKKTSFSAQKGMIEGMWYLQATERFKEDKAYANSKFEIYIKDRFAMLPNTYMELRLAFHNFREESLRYGPGLVLSAKKKCGAKKVPEVFKEIKATGEQTKKPITREKIQKIIEKHAKPAEPKKVEVKVDWRSRFEAERKLRLIAEANLKEAAEQVDRLKETVLRLKAYQTAIEQAAVKMRDTRISLAA